MNVSEKLRRRGREKVLFAASFPLPFTLLIVLLIFNSLRPDRLLPGGAVTTHLPTAILILLSILWIQTPRKVIKNPQTAYLAAFVLVMCIGAVFARNKAWAFEQLRGFFLFAFMPYLLTIQFVDTPFKVDRYLRLFLLSSMFFVVLGIARSGLVNVPVLSDENEFALFTNLLIPIAFFLGQEAKTSLRKTLYYSLVIILIFGTVTSFSRGGLVGLAGVGIFLFLMSNRKLYALLLLLGFGLVLLTIASDNYWADMETMFTEKGERGTGRDRLESWKAGWLMFLDHPIFGVGPRNFGMWVADYYSAWEARAPRHMWGRVAHSLYFTLIPETGVLGTVLFMLILWRNFLGHKYIESLERRKSGLLERANLGATEYLEFSKAIRNLKFLSRGLMGALIAFLTTGAFVSVLWYGYVWMLTSLCVISSNAARDIERALRIRIEPISPDLTPGLSASRS